MSLDPESEGHFTVLRPWHRLHTRSDVAVVGKARQIPCRPSLSISILANSSHCYVTGTESARKLGKFLVMSQFQGSVHSSALFLTAAAQNLLCLKLATEMGVVISSPWVTWVKGALAPALVGMLVTPCSRSVLFPCLHSAVIFFHLFGASSSPGSYSGAF